MVKKTLERHDLNREIITDEAEQLFFEKQYNRDPKLVLGLSHRWCDEHKLDKHSTLLSARFRKSMKKKGLKKYKA